MSLSCYFTVLVLAFQCAVVFGARDWSPVAFLADVLSHLPAGSVTLADGASGYIQQAVGSRE